MLHGPNDEARSGHRLWSHGLEDCLWAGEVLDSAWIARMERENRVHPRHSSERFGGLHHFVLLHKEGVCEVVAAGVRVHRLSGPHLSAVGEVLGVAFPVFIAHAPGDIRFLLDLLEMHGGLRD